MVCSGALLAAQARVNGGLQDRLGGGAAVASLVALVSFSVGTVAVLAVLFASKRARRALKELPQHRQELRWWYFLGGLGGASLVSVSAAAVPIIGVALLSVCTVAGQTAGSLVVDEVGLAPGGKRPISAQRVLGAGIAVVALLIGTAGHAHGDFSLGLVVAITIAGFLVAGQQAVNGQLAVVTGEARIAAAVSFIGGTLLLAVVTGVFELLGRLHDLHWPGEFWLYLLGVASRPVARLGVARRVSPGAGRGPERDNHCGSPAHLCGGRDHRQFTGTREVSTPPVLSGLDGVPGLPRTWRPLFGRVIGLVMAAVVVAGAVLLAVAIHGPDVHLFDRVGIAVLGVPVAAVLLMLARPRLVADSDGLTVVNLVRTRHVAWAEVVGVDLAETQSWASLDLADGTALPVLALQTADGARYRRAVTELRALVEQAAKQAGATP
jgi:transporter family-2 protein